MRARAILPVFLAAWLAAGEARSAEEALGVIIVPALERDRGLADNLNEVAMARLAETPGRRLVGTWELRRRAGPAFDNDLQGCLQRPSCLGNVGVSLGVSRVVTGAVRPEGTRFLLSLALIDIGASRVEGQFFRQVDGGVADLVHAVQEGVDELFNPRRAPGRIRIDSNPAGAHVAIDDVYLGTSPLLSGGLVPGSHRVRVELERRFPWKSVVEVPAGEQVDLHLGPGDLPPHRRWPLRAAYGSAAGATLCLPTGVVFGALATVTPSGQTRREAQADLERRRTYGQVGTALLVTGAVLAVTSAVLFLIHQGDGG